LQGVNLLASKVCTTKTQIFNISITALVREQSPRIIVFTNNDDEDSLKYFIAVEQMLILKSESLPAAMFLLLAAHYIFNMVYHNKVKDLMSNHNCAHGSPLPFCCLLDVTTTQQKPRVRCVPKQTRVTSLKCITDLL